ncbi:MAG: hypothetical protein HYZ13_09080 [Acidobacteria bacterium]|nr:hypothetical protein [Acidobacteriota bacterium]
MKPCKNPTCDEIRAAALQVGGVWDTLLASAAAGDPDAQGVLRHLENAPQVLDGLRRLAEALGELV